MQPRLCHGHYWQWSHVPLFSGCPRHAWQMVHMNFQPLTIPEIHANIPWVGPPSLYYCEVVSQQVATLQEIEEHAARSLLQRKDKSKVIHRRVKVPSSTGTDASQASTTWTSVAEELGCFGKWLTDHIAEFWVTQHAKGVWHANAEFSHWHLMNWEKPLRTPVLKMFPLRPSCWRMYWISNINCRFGSPNVIFMMLLVTLLMEPSGKGSLQTALWLPHRQRDHGIPQHHLVEKGDQANLCQVQTQPYLRVLFCAMMRTLLVGMYGCRLSRRGVISRFGNLLITVSPRAYTPTILVCVPSASLRMEKWYITYFTDI